MGDVLPGGCEDGGVGSAIGPISECCLIGYSFIVAEISGADTQRLCDLMKLDGLRLSKGVFK